MDRFRIIPKVGENRASILEAPSHGAAAMTVLMRGDVVEALDWSGGDEGGEWIKVRLVDAPTAAGGTTGFIERRFLGEPVTPRPLPADPVSLVRQCARIELQTGVNASPASPAIRADYLVALGLIETGLERVDPQLPGSDAVGPFQIDSAEWAEFVAANRFFGPADRFLPGPQPRCAAYLAQRDWVAFSALATGGEASDARGGPFVPTFVNLFQARLLGVEAAFDVFRAIEDDRAAGSMAELLRGRLAAGADALLQRRGRFLPDGGALGIAEFDAATRTLLTEKLAEAAGLLREHFPAFTGPAAGAPAAGGAQTGGAPAGGAPRMDAAEAEFRAWQDGGWTEGADPGRARVVSQYFPATEYHPDRPDPWCGAFVAWCVRQAGHDPVPGAARAANWVGWGGVEVRDRANIPRGAVVVLGKTPDSGGSGHVTFFNRWDGDRIECLGGNQGNTVKLSRYDPSRVVAVRWPEGAPPADEDDVLTLARTLWGEARGEDREGLEAVAAVIVNRARSGRYPAGVAAVCRQKWQFSCWNADDPNRPKMLRLPDGDEGGRWQTCLEVAREATAGGLQDPTGGALHYHTVDITPRWVVNSPGATVTLRRGRHVFYTGIR